MRAVEIHESAAEELKNRLPKLKRHTYNTIDRLMQDISARHKITGKKLHDLFVKKYGHTPDTWIKKLKKNLAEQDIVHKQLDELKCWSGYHRVKGTKAGSPGSCDKNTNEEQELDEKWSQKYKSSINCSNPKGFSQKAHCAGRKKNEDVAEGRVSQDFNSKKKLSEGDVVQFPKQQPIKSNLSPLQKKKRLTQRTDVKNIVPITRQTSNVPWNKLPKDVLKLANDWYWASEDNSGLDAVLDPKGYGSGTRNDLQYITAKLQQRGWAIDFNDEHDPPGEFNLILKNKNGQSLLLPIEDAQDFKGWAQGTSDYELSESIEQKDDVQQIKDFIKWAMITLNMQKPYPKITLSRNTKQAQQGHHTGLHHGDRIWVYIENRNLVDIFRTIFHELVHHRQYQLNMIKHNDSYPGSPIEMLADMAAGKYIKIYGKEHPEIFQ